MLSEKSDKMGQMIAKCCPKLNVLFCENDIHSYGNLPGLKFTRTKTIGAGDELCDFKMELL